jgi:hypothetical protein
VICQTKNTLKCLIIGLKNMIKKWDAGKMTADLFYDIFVIRNLNAK